MKPRLIDPKSPVPLYHQIAESIRTRIMAGELAAGDALEPLREAARTWGVNLHTVRHAYTALAREGLVESRGAGGTRVTGEGLPGDQGDERDIEEFLDHVLADARTLHGLGPRQLAAEIVRRAGTSAGDPVEIFVVECSVGQCLAHAAEIEGRYDVHAREWSLDRNSEPPPGSIIATYFHYNDIRRLWPGRLREVHFVTIIPDPAVVSRIPEGVERIFVCDRDAATAETVATDFSILLVPEGFKVESLVSDDVGSVASSMTENELILVAPRIWSDLDESTRASERIFAADYVIDEKELAAVAKKLDWQELSK